MLRRGTEKNCFPTIFPTPAALFRRRARFVLGSAAPMGIACALLIALVLLSPQASAFPLEFMDLNATGGGFGISNSVFVTVGGCGAQVFDDARFYSADDGKIVRVLGMSGDSGFQAMADCMTNGVDDILTVIYTLDGGGGLTQNISESDFFASVTRPGAPDLTGRKIRSFILRADEVTVSLAGFPPLFTSNFIFNGTFLVETRSGALPGPLLLIQ